MAQGLSRAMLAAAGRARQHLGGVCAHVAKWALGRMNADGGFRGRSAESDVFYTAFSVDCVLAAGGNVPAGRVAGYLDAFGDGEGLDLVHLASLARCRSRLSGTAGDGARSAAMLEHVEQARRADGGYASARGAQGSAYGCFLAWMAREDLGEGPPDAAGVARCLAALASADGAYGNARGMAAGTTTATAAGVTLLARMREPVPSEATAWLLARHDAGGGFYAAPGAPVPDLLSTATALFALTEAGAPVAGIRRACTAFVESLWDDAGAFAGSPADLTPDCEYTFYGLLAIGCLMPPGPGTEAAC